jgi:transposase-like protein
MMTPPDQQCADGRRFVLSGQMASNREKMFLNVFADWHCQGVKTALRINVPFGKISGPRRVRVGH